MSLAAHYPLSAVRCPLSAVRCPLSAVRCPLVATRPAGPCAFYHRTCQELVPPLSIPSPTTLLGLPPASLQSPLRPPPPPPQQSLATPCVCIHREISLPSVYCVHVRRLAGAIFTQCSSARPPSRLAGWRGDSQGDSPVCGLRTSDSILMTQLDHGWLTLGRPRHATAVRQRKMGALIRSSEDGGRITARDSTKMPAGQRRQSTNGHQCGCRSMHCPADQRLITGQANRRHIRSDQRGK